jgi:hypothetical protein
MELLTPDLSRPICTADSSRICQRPERRLTFELDTLRMDLRENATVVRGEVHLLERAFEAQINELRGELLRWGLLFWIGQAAATGAIVAGLLTF